MTSYLIQFPFSQTQQRAGNPRGNPMADGYVHAPPSDQQQFAMELLRLEIPFNYSPIYPEFTVLLPSDDLVAVRELEVIAARFRVSNISVL